MATDAARPRPRRRHRRRRDRHQRRLPPDQARPHRRRAARAGPTVLRHHLARRRAGRPAARIGERAPGWCSTRPQLYAELEDETGLSAGYKQCGGVTVARTEDRMIQLRRTAATAAAFDLECELLTPEQALEHYPVMRVDDLVGAIWLPGDGKANPTDLTFALAKGARMRGARIVEKIRVLDVLDRRRTRSPACAPTPATSRPRSSSTAPGQWAKQVGAMAGVNVPLHSAEHFYVVTEQIDGVHPDLPILRDPDGYTYFKEEVGGLVVGGFEPEAKPWVSPDEIPYPFEFQLLEEDWEHFEILMDSALLRIPALEETGIKKFYNGPESFTPDNQFILGEAPEVRELLRRRRLQLGRHRHRGRRRPGAGRVDRRRRADQRPDRRRHPPLRAVQRQQPLAARPGRRGARAALRDPVAQPRDDDRAAVPPLAGAPPARGGRRQLRQQDGLGAGQLLRPAGQPTRRSSTPGASRTGCRGRPPSRPAPAPAVTVFDQTSFSKYLLVGPRRRGGAAVAVHRRRRRRRSAGRSTPGCSTSAAPTSPTSP